MKSSQKRQSGEDKFVASVSRKQAFVRLHDRVGYRRGFVSALARELGVDASSLGKALTLDSVQVDRCNPAYLFTASLARRVEKALELEPMILEGRPPSHQEGTAERHDALVSRVHAYLQSLYSQYANDLEVVSEYRTPASLNGSATYTDLAVVNSNGDPIVIVDCKLTEVLSEGVIKRLMQEVGFAGFMVGAQFAAFAIPELDKENSSRFRLYCYELNVCKVNVLKALPSGAELMRSASTSGRI